jgi:hypothetical protein
MMSQATLNCQYDLNELVRSNKELACWLGDDFPEPPVYLGGLRDGRWESTVELSAYARRLSTLLIPDLASGAGRVAETALRFSNRVAVLAVQASVEFNSRDYWTILNMMSQDQVADRVIADAQAYLCASPQLADVVTEFLPFIDVDDQHPYLAETIAAHGLMIVDRAWPPMASEPSSV